ncbi:MAG: adenylate/guanylate cyclase domain-containing protein [Alphaproteobacteria bacterium]|jgi:adenylate cyclase|nr:adenylate/guanylate cyclase domain-containing protein [Alphaproteobacteria bacterium]HJP20191.1 adenylate/guanylate cyclase domain-containing protein [Alphaproteobacteria bacterium]
MHRLRPWLHILIPLAILGLALLVRGAFPGPVEEVQLKVFDIYQRIKPRPYEPAPVKFIDLDDESLSQLGQWPWPRTVVAELLARLANAGAAAIAFDIVFAEPDRTSPANILPIWPETPEIKALLQRADELPDHDRLLAEIIAQINVVTGFVLTTEEGGGEPLLKGSFAMAGDDPKPFLPTYLGAVTNLPVIEKAASGNGSFSLVPEADGIVRRVPLLFRKGNQIYPSLSADLLRVAQGARTTIIKSSGASGETAYGEKTGLNHVKIGGLVVPTDANGRIWLHYTEDVPDRVVPAWTLFSDDFDKSRVEGQLMMIGTSAAGLKDLRATPLNPAQAGALIHVAALEQIMLNYFLERPDWANGLEIIFLIVLGGALIGLLPWLGALWCAVIAVVGVTGAITVSWTLFAGYRLLLDPVSPSVVVLLIYLSGSLINYLRSEAERQQVRGAFSRYLSPALVEQLADDPERLMLGGEMRNMTLLFADIRGFTTISEQFKTDPQGLTNLINRFLTPMTDMILSRRGTIDKYMGDCIMAFWNAPLDDGEHVANACESALAMFQRLESLNAEIKAEREAEQKPFYPINIGIGLNTGECCVGNMGAEQRFDYSVLGDAVNLASRLEGQSKNYGVGIVIGEQTQIDARDYATLELDLIAVKGKEEAVRIFSLVGDRSKLDDPAFRTLVVRHEEMLHSYRAQQWHRAQQSLAECRRLDSAGEFEVLHGLYDERIAAYQADPPGPDWDGVFIATSK